MFERIAGQWQNRGIVVSGTAHDGDRFGDAVALHGDRAFVAAPGEGLGHGSVRVYDRFGTSWISFGLVKPGDLQPDTQFGSAIALTSVGGRDVLHFGAPDRNEMAGAVFRVEWPGVDSSEFELMELALPDPLPSSGRLGASLHAREGSVAAAAPSATVLASLEAAHLGGPAPQVAAGMAYVYPPDGVGAPDMLVASIPVNGARLGEGIVITGVDAHGVNEVLIGAPGDSVGTAYQSGLVRMFGSFTGFADGFEEGAAAPSE